MIVWLFTYDMTVGPLAYAIVGEVSSTRLRNKTVGLSRMSYNVFSVMFGVLTPYMLVSLHVYLHTSGSDMDTQNPTEWNWEGTLIPLFCRAVC